MSGKKKNHCADTVFSNTEKNIHIFNVWAGTVMGTWAERLKDCSDINIRHIRGETTIGSVSLNQLVIAKGNDRYIFSAQVDDMGAITYNMPNLDPENIRFSIDTDPQPIELDGSTPVDTVVDTFDNVLDALLKFLARSYLEEQDRQKRQRQLDVCTQKFMEWAKLSVKAFPDLDLEYVCEHPENAELRAHIDPHNIIGFSIARTVTQQKNQLCVPRIPLQQEQIDWTTVGIATATPSVWMYDYMNECLRILDKKYGSGRSRNTKIALFEQWAETMLEDWNRIQSTDNVHLVTDTNAADLLRLSVEITSHVIQHHGEVSKFVFELAIRETDTIQLVFPAIKDDDARCYPNVSKIRDVNPESFLEATEAMLRLMKWASSVSEKSNSKQPDLAGEFRLWVTKIVYPWIDQLKHCDMIGFSFIPDNCSGNEPQMTINFGKYRLWFGVRNLDGKWYVRHPVLSQISDVKQALADHDDSTSMINASPRNWEEGATRTVEAVCQYCLDRFPPVLTIEEQTHNICEGFEAWAKSKVEQWEVVLNDLNGEHFVHLTYSENPEQHSQLVLCKGKINEGPTSSECPISLVLAWKLIKNKPHEIPLMYGPTMVKYKDGNFYTTPHAVQAFTLKDLDRVGKQIDVAISEAMVAVAALNHQKDEKLETQ